MNRQVTFQLHPDRATRDFLLHLAVRMHQLRINPEAFTMMSGPGPSTWSLLVGPNARLEELVSALNESGVSQLVVADRPANAGRPPDEPEPRQAMD